METTEFLREVIKYIRSNNQGEYPEIYYEALSRLEVENANEKIAKAVEILESEIGDIQSDECDCGDPGDCDRPCEEKE